MSKMVQAFIGLGSNQGNAVKNVCNAIGELGQIAGTRLGHCSSLYRSAPVGYLDQPDFVNAVCQVDTSSPAPVLLEQLQRLEQKAGRRRDGVRWGPRTLDLDILLYDDAVLDTDSLVVPHPRMHERAFVLYPLQEIAPELRIPGIGSLDELVALCADQDCERLVEGC
ncbi:MAG: 2-amino-4-hydroxy-6-hydroxymethyldihydropteridine diphosphokinase [Acidiferrobacterales bacterium]